MAAMDVLVVLFVLSLARCGTVMGGTPAECEERLNALNDSLTALKAEVEHDEHQAHHSALFSVFRSGSSNVVEEETIIFDDVRLNRDGGYNASTGIFTCPNTGIYSLSYSALPAGGAVVRVALVKNREALNYLYANLASGMSLLSERTILHNLVKGEEVWVELQEGTLLGAEGRAKMSFQGYRISD